MEMTHFVLITGPFVGRSSMLDTAEALRRSGSMVTEPNPHLDHPDAIPPLQDWAETLPPAIPRGPAPIVVGYSAGTVLATWLAPRIGASALLLVDGDIPPASGPCPILPERVAQRLRGRAGADGLPRWSDWWSDLSMEEEIGLAPLARTRPDLVDPMSREERRFPTDWLDQTLDLTDWSDIPTGYLRLSRFFDEQASEAEKRRWPVQRIDGSHLHPAIMGTETAGALMALAGELEF